MKPLIPIVLMTAMASASLPALANLELAQKNACTACHAMGKKIRFFRTICGRFAAVLSV